MVFEPKKRAFWQRVFEQLRLIYRAPPIMSEVTEVIEIKEDTRFFPEILIRGVFRLVDGRQITVDANYQSGEDEIRQARYTCVD